MSDSEWLAGLKPGDQVVHSYGYGRGSLHLEEVHSATAHRIRIGERGQTEFFRKTGLRVGTAHQVGPSKLLPPTPERLAEVRSAALVSRLRHNVPWDRLPLETLEAVAAVIWPATPEKKEGEGMTEANPATAP